MKAIVQDRYGSADVLKFEDIDEPVMGEDDVLVRVKAAGCGPDVWHLMTGMPYMARLAIGLREPKAKVLGWDVAGTVEAVGANVTGLQPGDEVMGTAKGSFAELVIADAGDLIPKPANLSFEQAAALPVSGVTALRAIRDEGHVQPGQTVLVDRCGRRRRVARRADRQGRRREGHRRVQHLEGGPGPFARRGRRDRLHARRLHRRVPALGRDHRHRGPSPVVRAAPRAHPEGHPRDRGWRRRWAVDRRLLPRDAAGPRRVPLRGTEAPRTGHEDQARRTSSPSRSSSRPAASRR